MDNRELEVALLKIQDKLDVLGSKLMEIDERLLRNSQEIGEIGTELSVLKIQGNKKCQCRT